MKVQLDQFRSACCLLPQVLSVLHATSSAGIWSIHGEQLTLVRLGILLHDGQSSTAAPIPEPVVTLNAPVVSVRLVPRGESVSFGSVWTADRPTLIATPHVKLLRSGEFLRAESETVETSRYFNWAAIERSKPGKVAALTVLDAEFTRANSRRTRSRKARLSFLGGGLDSRCIVSRLSELGLEVTALTIDRDVPDIPLGRQFTRSLGIRHVMIPPYRTAQGRLWLGDVLNRGNSLDVDCRMIFSNDGGSVGMAQRSAPGGCPSMLALAGKTIAFVAAVKHDHDPHGIAPSRRGREDVLGGSMDAASFLRILKSM